jgi:hypothetical protein
MLGIHNPLLHTYLSLQVFWDHFWHYSHARNNKSLL